MPRPESTVKGGFYPFFVTHIPAIASYFQTTRQGGLLLDPCAGEGEALEALAEALGLTPYANELDEERAALCLERFGHEQSVQGHIKTLRTSHNAYVLQWNNPPYTFNKTGEEKRRELDFLKHPGRTAGCRQRWQRFRR